MSEDPQVAGQLQLFYTEDEVQAKITQVVNNLTETHTHDVQYQLVRQRRQLHEAVYEACKGMLNEVDDESMISIYNTIAEACGWDTIDAFTKLYTVSVCYKGTEVAIFTDIEADDEESAQDKVLEDMSIDNVSIAFDISYGNNSDSGEVEVSSWDIDTDEFTAEATEQD